MRRSNWTHWIVFAGLLWLAAGARAQTQTTVTGTIKDLSGSVVTSGQITFDLRPGIDTTISGSARFVPQTVTCQINGSGQPVGPAGTGACLVTYNTALTPAGTYYLVTIWPGYVSSSQFNWYAMSASQDISTAVPTPATAPAYTFVDTQSNQTIGGDKTFSGHVTMSSIEQVRYADQFAGSDVCAKINAAEAALPAAGGTVSALGVAPGSYSCATTLSIGSPTQGVTLLLGPITLKVAGTVNVAQASALIGAGSASGNAGVDPTTIKADTGFPSNTALVQAGPSSGTAAGTRLADFAIDCDAHAGCTGLDMESVEDASEVRNVSVYNYETTGIAISGASQAVGFYNTTVSAASDASADNGLTITGNSDHVVLENFGATSTNATPSTGAAIDCQGCNIYVHGAHLEDHADGVRLEGCSGCSGSPTLTGINGLGNVANLVHIASNWAGSVYAVGLRKFGATNAILDDRSGATLTCTDETLAAYITANAQDITQRITTCTDVPGKLSGLIVARGDFAQWDASDPVMQVSALSGLAGFWAGESATKNVQLNWFPSTHEAKLFTASTAYPLSLDGSLLKLNVGSGAPTTIGGTLGWGGGQVIPSSNGVTLSGANGLSAGTVTLSGGAGSHAFAGAYTAAPVCTATDQTTAAAVKATATTTAVTLSGAGTDVVNWACSPAVN